jgi:hypothetical protein
MLRVERPSQKPLKLAVPNVQTGAATSTFVYFYVPRDTKHIRTLPGN